MAFGKSLGDILFEEGWSLGPVSKYIGPITEERLIQFTGYDDNEVRDELCLESLVAAEVITRAEHVDALTKLMVPGQEFALRSTPPAPKIEAVLPNGKKVKFGEERNEPKFS